MISLNRVRKQRLSAKETSITSCEVLDEKYHTIVQGIFVGIIIKASAASLKVTDLLFAFTFCKRKPGKLVSSLTGCLLFVVCCLLIIILINTFSELFRPATTTQPRRTTKCVCNIVFPFVYWSVEHAVLVVTFRLSKVADNIYLDL